MVGGGQVALRKVEDALRAGLRVTVVAPSAVPALRDLAARGCVDWENRPFRPEDVRGTFLVFAAATPVVNGEVSAAARAAGALVNVADHPRISDFISPAVLQRGPVTVAVSTGGASPALAARLRDRVAAVVGEEVGEWAALLRRFRTRVQKTVPEGRARHELLRRVGGLDGAGMIARGERRALEELLESWLRAAAGDGVPGGPPGMEGEGGG